MFSAAAQEGLDESTLEKMLLPELRQVYRSLGGKPGTLRKSELVNECSKLAAAFYSVKREDKKDDPLKDFVKPATNTAYVPPQHRMTPRSNATSDKPYRKVNTTQFITNNHDGASSHDGHRKGKIPFGEQRDSRFDEPAGDLELSFLGTASCVPTVSRGVSSIALRYNSDVWLFDCGEATQIQLQRSRIKPSKIRKIFISHVHGDHSFGLPGMLCLLGQSTQEERGKAQAEGEIPTVLDIYGPEGLRDYIRATIQLTFSKVASPYRVHELKNVPYLHSRVIKYPPPKPMIKTRFDATYGERPGGMDIFPDQDGVYHLFDEAEVVMKAAPMQHTIPCVGFVMHEKEKLGSLKPELVDKLVEENKEALRQLPEFRMNHKKVFRYLKELSINETYTFPNGVVVNGKDINEPSRRGRKIVVMGDTCDGAMIQNIAMDADVLIHEATNAFLPGYETTSSRYSSLQQLERDSYNHGHSTPEMAGRFAKKIRAQKLILTHFSPRYPGDSSESSMKMMWKLEEMAKATCGLSGVNDVIAAWDLMSVNIPQIK